MAHTKPVCELIVGSYTRQVNPVAIRFIHEGVLVEKKVDKHQKIDVYDDGVVIVEYGENGGDCPEYATFVYNEDVLEIDLPPLPALSLVRARCGELICVERES